jgi:alanine racemase
MVGNRESIDSLASEAAKRRKPVQVHLKVDTGMGRIGCQPDEAPELAERIDSADWLELSGVCTHFPVADTADREFTAWQLDRFRACVDGIRSRGIDPATLHAANSGAILDHPQSAFRMVRPGIMLYGYYPSHEQARNLALKPVMELLSKVVFLKKVPRGTGISYGLTHRVERDTTIATIPAGYADGYNRLLSNRGQVCIRGRRYPIVGRVCMDQTMVDVGPDSEVELYDEVILFGPHPPAPDAEEIAGLMQTIPYEVTCLISRRVPRVFGQ